MGAPRIVAVVTATPLHRLDQAALLRIAGYDDPETFTPDEGVDEVQARFRRGAVALGPGFAAEGALFRW